MRITQQDLQGMFDRVRRSLVSMQVDVSGLYLEMGSAANGISYKLRRTVGEHGGVAGVIMPDGHLGRTRLEAYVTLHAIAQALEFANDAHRDRMRLV